MCENYNGRYHNIYFDHFFSFTVLMKMLFEKQMYVCWTVHAGRTDGPRVQEPYIPKNEEE